MPNVTISDLPPATLPLDGPNSFFEVQTTESGEVVSRKVASDDIVITTGSSTITGTGVVSPSAGTPYDYDAQLSFENANAELTAVVGWNTSAFIILNQARGATFNIQGTSAAGLPTAVLTAEPGVEAVLFGGTTNLTLQDNEMTFRDFVGSSPRDHLLRWTQGSFIETESARIGFNASDTFSISNVNADVELLNVDVAVLRTTTAAAGGALVNNLSTGAGFERVLTTADLGGGLPSGSLGDMVYISTAPSTYSAQSVLQVTPSTNTVNITSTSVASQLSMVQAAGGENFEITTSDILAFGTTQVNLGFSGGFIFLNANQGGSLTITGTAGFTLASGATNSFVFRETGANNELLIDFVSPDWLIRHQDIDGGLQLAGRNSGGSFVQFIDMDPNADVDIYHPLSGVVVARTLTPAAGGLSANNTLTGAGFERVLTTSDLGGVADPLTIGQIIITNTNIVDLVDSDVALVVAGAGSARHIEIAQGTFGQAIQSKTTATTVDSLEINRLGGDVDIGSLNASVAGGVNLNFSSGAVASTVVEVTQAGIILEGITGSNTILDFHTPGGNLVMRQVFNGANLQFDGFLNSLEYQFQSRNSGGTIRQLLHMDPDTDIEIYHPPSAAIAIETHTPATGGAFVNNTLTGPGLERVLTESDLTASVVVGSVQGAARSTSLIRNSTTTLADDPVLSGFILEPSAIFHVECVLRFRGNGSVNAGFRWGWDFNGQLANLDTLEGRVNSHQQDNSTSNFLAYQLVQLGTKATFSNLTITESVYMSFVVITQSDYVSGTAMDLQWAQGTNSANDTLLDEGSFVKVVRLA